MSTKIVRLSPAYPCGWEDQHTLRFGFDRVAVRLDDPTAGEQRFIVMLQAGLPTSRYSAASRKAGISDAERHSLLERLAPALIFDTPDAAARTRGRSNRGIAVVGEGAAVPMVRDELTRGSLHESHPGSAEAVVLVDRYLSPATDALDFEARGVAVLPVRFTDLGFTIGPLLHPQQPFCASCLELHERAQDPGRFIMLPQFDGRIPTAETPQASRFATVTALHLLESWLAGTDLLGEHRLRFAVRRGRVLPVPQTERMLQHPQCGCAFAEHDGSDIAA